MRITKNGAWLGALIILAFLATRWFLFPLASRNQRSVTAPSATRLVATPAGREELEKFQGAWEFVSLEVDGDRKPDADFKKYTVVFRGDQWIVSEGTNIAAETTIVLDPTANPKSIDVFPPPGKGQPIHGIYLLEGDTLTICDRGEDNGDRPAGFGTEPNSGLVLIVYKQAQR